MSRKPLGHDDDDWCEKNCGNMSETCPPLPKGELDQLLFLHPFIFCTGQIDRWIWRPLMVDQFDRFYKISTSTQILLSETD